MRRAIATILLFGGRRMSGRQMVLFDAIAGYLALGRWLKLRGFGRIRRVRNREDLFDLALPSLRGRRPLYVELGVHEGQSMSWWSKHLDDPDACLHGFDTFHGLPEMWNEEHSKGHFSTGGKVPDFDDPRIRFFPGYFDDTLSSYDAPPHGSVFLNFDADLYSSTISALRHLNDLIKPGTWLYFDELNDKHHELRALDEFIEETGLTLSFAARAANGRHWLFRI